MATSIVSVKAVCGASALTQVSAGRHSLTIDEPVAFGGQDTAPSPILYLLAGVAGCVNAAGRLAAQDLGFELRGLEIEVAGETDAARFFGQESPNRAGFESLTIKIAADTDAPREQLDAWLAQVQYRCPVLDNIQNATPVSYQLSISGIL